MTTFTRESTSETLLSPIELAEHVSCGKPTRGEVWFAIAALSAFYGAIGYGIYLILVAGG